MSHDVFISYSSTDKAIAYAICSKLENNKIRCWIAPRDILPGVEFGEAIINAIADCKILLLVFSGKANNSPQVRREVERAVSKGKIILPFRIEDILPTKAMEFALSNTHWLDAMTPPLEVHIATLSDTVCRLLNRQLEAAAPIPKPAQKPIFDKVHLEKPEPALALDSPIPKPAQKLISDKVHFLVNSPATVERGQSFIFDVWAHIEKQRSIVMERIKESISQASSPPIIKTKGPTVISRGTLLYVRVRFSDFKVEPEEGIILWDGEIGNTSFIISVPNELKEGTFVGMVTIRWEGGSQIAGIPVQIKVELKSSLNISESFQIKQIKKAFASYANDDRDEVLGRIQGMQKILPDLKVFIDVVDLRSGENWSNKLWEEIPQNDVFYLFWSEAAKSSAWVEKEWRCALQTKGLDFIDPVPLVSPEKVKPPEELSQKHFNDWILAFTRGKQVPEIITRLEQAQDHDIERETLLRDIPILVKRTPLGAFKKNLSLKPDQEGILVTCDDFYYDELKFSYTFRLPGPHKFLTADTFVQCNVSADVNKNFTLGPYSREVAITLAKALNRLNALLSEEVNVIKTITNEKDGTQLVPNVNLR